MNPQPIEQSDRPRRSRSNRHGTVSLAMPSRLPAVGEQATPSDGRPPSRSPQPVAEHLAGTSAARRISPVENVAIQIFSGNIEIGPRERKELETHQGVGQHGWPLLLNRDQLCEYLGASWRTLKNVLTVRPVDLGANVVRYSRLQIDEWVATLPPRFLSSQKQGGDTDKEAGTQAGTAEVDITESRVAAALDRVRARAGGSKWRKKA